VPGGTFDKSDDKTGDKSDDKTELDLACRAARMARGVVTIGILFALLMALLCGLSLYQSREEALAHTADSLQDLSLLVQRDVQRNLELYDLSLQAVVEGLQQPEVMRLPTAMKRQLLFDRATTARYLGSMLVLDAAGNIIIDAEHDIPRVSNFADRAYFQVQRDHADLGLYVSDPFESRLRHGAPSIALTRRLSHPDGSFAGVVLLTVQLNYFHDLFAGLALGTHGSIVLLNTRGVLIMRQPIVAEIGRSYSQSKLFVRFAEPAESGQFVETPMLDHVRRLYAYRKISPYSLIIACAAAEKDIYADWNRRALLLGAIMTVSMTGFVVLSFVLGEQLKRRLLAEGNLRKLARTDALTGLNNRRTLSGILEKEWRRSQRTHHAFSLLFIDIDHFKAYNDTYGHLSGDQALAAVARCISANIRAAVDSAARYGGEEFVVVLPETGEAAARTVAGKMITAIAALDIPHAKSEYRRVTISVGAATWHPSSHATVSAVVQSADEALYRAKAAGRNRVMSGGSA
jgi:diguanylate cyclase (GGDEF)-like protein